MDSKDNIRVFEENAKEYDEWFDRHQGLFQSELWAVKKAIPENKKGIEIGVGTGRFASALGMKFGVEPSENMAKIAEDRGIQVFRAMAENLPIENNSFDFALMVTTVCFLDDIPKAFFEVNRILKPDGEFIVAIIEKSSELGKKYETEKSKNKFYQNAQFHSTEEIANNLRDAGFEKFSYCQTLLSPNENKIEEPLLGYDKGGFVVIHSAKKN